MKSLDDIRYELKEIRYYYARKDMFDRMGTIVESDVVQKAARYNAFIKAAPVVLYDLYMSLYVWNNTQEALADDWNVSFSYIRKLHEKLLRYLQVNMTGGMRG